ncbi:MAG: hypothetical protein CBB87_06700 [Micavibrio sp. TMED27]|nr:hypothetical protein [Micavibrio sp.]OUT91696.1 MAG: hypothetical protein CBB87_06700 [Micavibrio sp. TMED27]|tara:strand:- start:1863 stop:2252 length:390 start_codon:yes stop_codon:yes gene_type:complete
MSTETFKEFEAGQEILKHGQNASCAYMIKSGSVRVFVSEGSREVELALLKEGQIFGETAILDGGVYGANISAVEDTELLVITPENLQDILEQSDPFIRELLKMMIERLKSTNEALLKSETREFMDIVLI